MKLQTRVFWGYGTVLGLMILVAIVTYQGFSRLTASENSVAYTQDVISQAYKVQKLLVDMETGQRGFLITGTEEFLEPFEQGNAQYQRAIVELKQSVAGNPTQLRKIESFERDVRSWKEESAVPEIEMRRGIVKGAIDANYLQRVLARGDGKNILDSMRQIFDEMETSFDIAGNAEAVVLTTAIAKSMVDQETGQRGYLIVGEDEFLEPYREGGVSFINKIAALKALVGNAHDRIGTASDLNQLEKLADQWRQRAGEAEIALRRQQDAGQVSQQEIARVLREGTGKKILDQMRDITNRLNAMFLVAENEKAIGLLVAVIKAMVDQETGQRGFIITGREEFLEPYNEGQRAFGMALKELRKTNANAYDVGSMQRSISQLETLASEWQTKAAMPEINARKQMNSASTSFKDIQQLTESGRGKDAMDLLRGQLADFLAEEEEILLERIVDSKNTVDTSRTVLVFGTLLAIALGLFVMSINTRKILDEVGGEPADIAEVTARIARGDLDADTPQGSTGIAAGVGVMLIALRKSKQVATQQDWLKSGLNNLFERMKGDREMLELADEVIQYLAEYLNVQIGALYVVEPQSDILQLMGSYAFTRRKGLNDRIKIGEGLVGESARTRKIISVSELPEGYTRISSSIGDSQPANIVVLPLVYSGELKGVIELGAIKEIDDISLEFLQSVAAPIAIGINTTQGRLELNAANEDLQEQTLRLTNSEEELKSQADQLIASNEELQEQTLRLTNSEEELKSQSEALRTSNEELEEKQDSLKAQSAYLASSKNELESQASELVRASKYKSEFLANMSHELRTPLNSLLILSKMLKENKEGNLSDKQVESAEIIHSGGNELLQLINDILDLSKVEAGEIRLNVNEVEIADIEQTLLNQFKHLADDKPFEFKVEFSADLPLSFHTDKQRTLQIIKNLLANAFKFTHAGTVELRAFVPTDDVCFKQPRLAANTCIGFAVTDTGIGISDNEQSSIFGAFQQVDGSRGRDYGGTGLGLTISRTLIELLQGEIQLESQLGKGSTFTVYLPLHYDSNYPAQSPLSAPSLESFASSVHEVGGPVSPSLTPHSREVEALHEIPFFIPDDRDVINADSRSVLIIEDDMDFAAVLKGIAHQKDYSCLVAGNGHCALRLAKQYSPSAILLDLGLPDIDGLKLIDLMKADLITRHIPIHVVTGREQMGDALARGAVGFLHKPTSAEELDNVFVIFDHYLTSKNKRILVIEDNKDYRNSLVTLLDIKDVTITEASNGKDGLKYLQDENFDCVVLDMGLPDISGAEMLRQLSETKTKPIPPIIINTGRDISEELFKELNKYTEEIIVKGTESADRLLDEVTLFLHQAESKLPDAQRKTLQMLHDDTVALKGFTVLMVDDDLRNTFALSNLLEGHGLEVIVAENGQKALDCLEENSDIDLVLMDIMMPVMDGYEAMERIRAQDQYQHLPIIALTAKAMAEDKSRCIEAGANDYMNKPIDADKLLSLIKVIIH